MISHSNQQELLLKNAQRVISLFQKSIDKFNQSNMPDLANQWKKILLNYKRAVKVKLQG
nr:hypothetical protein [Candidatus Sigynarchaeota archaeon]